MSAQDKVEKILRELHVMASKGPSIPKQPEMVVIERKKMTDLLTELNGCMYEVMDEHELTIQSRDKAEREFRKQSDVILQDASQNAEDIYAAAFMYTDEALMHVQEIMKENTRTLEGMYMAMKEELEKQVRQVKSNQLELKSNLQDLKDTDKYLNLIKDRNREIERQKKEGEEMPYEEASIYAGRTTEIKINTEYFEKMGITPEQEVPPETEAPKKAEVVIKVADSVQEAERASAAEKANKEEESVISDLQFMDDLDAEYFQWKEEQEEKPESKEKLSKTKDLTESFQKAWRTITQHN